MFSYKERAVKGVANIPFSFLFLFLVQSKYGGKSVSPFHVWEFFIIFLVSMGGLGFHISGLGHFFYSSLVISFFIGDMVFIWLYERGLFS